MKHKTNIFKGFILAMILLIIMTSQLPIAEANNYKDTTFSEFYSGYNIVETGYRYKSDTTSSYIYNSGSPCGVYVNVWGAYGVIEDGVFYVRPGQEECCNYNGIVTVGKGQSKKLLNTVREKGWTFAGLHMTGAELRVHLSGLWSPDSI